MNTSKLREKSVEELNAELTELLREGFNLRMQKSTGQLAQLSQIKANRRNVARVMTIMTEKAGN